MGSQNDRSSNMMHAGAIASPIVRLLICIVAVFVVTAVLDTVSLRDRPLFPLLIFLFLVLTASSLWGFRYALFVSLLAALGFSWLRPPVGRFWLSDARDIFALAAFLVIGIITSHLSDRARREALIAKRAEDAVRRSEGGLREVIETMPAMAWSALPDGSNAFVNRQWAEYTGLSAEQTADSGWRNTVHPEDVTGHMEKWRQSLATGQLFEHEVRLRRTADGQYRWFLLRGMPLRDEHGEVLKWCGIATDIEDRKRAEEGLRKSEELWRSVFENSAIGVALTDLNGRFLATNHVFQTMVGYTEEELRALTFLDVTHEDYLEANWALVTELMEGKRRQFQIEKKYRRKDGSLIWVSNNVSFLPDTERVQQFLMALSEDITERKRAETLLTGEKRILEMVAKGDPLPQILDSVCRFVEEHAVGFLASILLLDGNRLRHGGAPSLPKIYTDAIDGALIGPSAGSCGTAAYRGEQVIVEDIATDPLWADYREAALPHFLRACWSTPVFSSQGKVIAIFAMYYREPRSPSLHDLEIIEQITHLAGVAIERTLTQEALQRSEAYLAEAQRLTHTGSWAWNVRTGSHFWSQEVFRIYEYDPGMTPTWDFLLERAHPEDRSEIERRVKMESTQKEWTDSESDFRIVLPDGTIRHLHAIAHPVMDESGEITDVVGTIMDVTERKGAEEKLRRSEEFLFEAQRLSHTGSWKHDVAAGAVIVSPEIHRIFGVRPGEDISSVGFWLSRNHPEDQQRIQELFERSESQKTDYEADYRIVLPDGAIKHLHAVGHPVLNKSGDLVEFLGTAMDVTEQVQTRAALENALQEIKQRNEALRASEQNLTLIINTILALVWSARPDGSAEFFNQHYLDYVGLSAEQAKDWGWTVAVHPEDLNGLAGAWQSIMVSGKQGESEARLRRFDGEYRWFLFRANPLRDESGNIVRWFGINTDIEDRKRAEEKLRRNERDLHEAQRITHTGSWRYDVSSQKVTNSPEGDRIYGIQPNEDASAPDFYFSRVHPDDRKRIRELFERCATQKLDYQSEYAIVLPDGTIKHVHAIGHPVLNESGDLVEFVGTTMDITERKQTEEALRRSEAYLAEAQRMTHTGSWAWNLRTDALFWSQEIFRICDCDPEMTPTWGFLLERVHPEDRLEMERRRKREATTKEWADSELEFRIVLPDGTIKHLHSIAHPVMDESGEITEVVGSVRDVTERNRAQEQRERLRQLETDLAHMNRVTMLGELASSLAHELNQPIAAAITSANACLRWLAHNPPDLERARAAVTRIENDGSRAAEIIQRMRAFYKTGAPPKRELVDLNQVAREMLALLRNEADRHSISLRTELALQLPQIIADRVQLQQVLMNLLLNGIEAITDGPGELIIRSQSTEDGRLLISVTDTGVGLPSENLDRLFSAFYTTKPQGTGMGLAISRSIIEAHGGRLWATANAERGATFHFTLPAELQQ
jgi:PAS domain S-box-containing protein